MIWNRLLPIVLMIVGVAACARDAALDRIKLPAGFHVELLAHVPGARQMALGQSNVLFVGSIRQGRVYAIPLDPQYRAGNAVVVASDLQMPSGVAYRAGSLYIGAVDRILRLDNIEQRLDAPPEPVVVNRELPSDTHHGWKFIAFGPDGLLYVPVGAPCNICEPDPERYAAIRRMRADGTGLETYARGIRNSVGFDWNPQDGTLWFTDNGRDLLGDDVPGDELDHAPKAGLHFGYPYCHEGSVADPEYGAKRRCTEFVPPVANLGAHVAALGMRFYTGNMFPASYRNAIFVAEHGSWNRSRKVGYRVMVLRVEGSRVLSQEVFASGWLQGEDAWGRPADVLVLPDGSLLVSDDYAGAIYRITYNAQDRRG